MKFRRARRPFIACIEPTPDAVEWPDGESQHHRPLAPATCATGKPCRPVLEFPDHRLHQLGGGLTGWMRRELVEKRGWLDDKQFLSCYALCQIVPGATNVNLAVLIGAQLRGAVGALAAFSGLLLAPLAILLTIGFFFSPRTGRPAEGCSMRR